MKFSMFFIAEYGHLVTASALMATLFLGGWDIPFWRGDDAFWYQGALISGFGPDGAPVAANPAWWKTMLTLGAFTLKTGFFVVLYIWVRWTLPRFRYDQVMQLGWKILLPVSLAYIMIVSGTVLALNQVGMTWGFLYGLALTAVSGVCTVVFVFFMDRGHIISGAGARGRPEGTEVGPGGRRRIGAGRELTPISADDRVRAGLPASPPT
jgi:NADH-quinone oxidoreductase subunit H